MRTIKKKIWGRMKYIGQGLLLLAVGGWGLQQVPITGCRLADLTSTPDDALMVSAGEDAPVDGDGAAQKRVFLTFDDGPSPTTEKVLQVLQEEGVPATFFVMAAENNEEYLPLVKQELAQGNEIALHTCCHSYKTIYASPAAYWADLDALKQKLAPYMDAQGIHWLRFPGGSTNTVSHRYGGDAIMERLKAQAAEKGYHYADWNVCADDAVGGHPSAREVYENIIRDVKKDQDCCVVLMHDTAATGTTAEALPDVIDWFREQGYTFCTISALEEEKAEA